MPLIEKHNKRDLRFSRMHREEFPAGFAMSDVDWMLYDKENNSIAMLEEKHGNIRLVDLTTPQIVRHVKMADKLGIPLFITVIAPKGEEEDAWNHWAFYVIAVNDLANASLTKFGYRSGYKLMSQREYFRFECHLRNVKSTEKEEMRYETELPKWYVPEIQY
jgi:hypothetical protein